MSLSFLSFPYPSAGDGFWSPLTATLNWCEEDYYATVYSAEIINALTNLYFVYLAVQGIRNCRQNGHDIACQVAFFNMLFIGIGSICFHTTLNYEMQLLDELSMIYLTCTTFYAMFSYGQRPAVKCLVLVFIIAVAVFVTLYYHYLKDPAFHQNAFAVLAATVIFKGVYEMEVLLRPSRRPVNPSLSEKEKSKVDQRNLSILYKMWALALCGVAYVGFGFLLWNLDNIYCTHLRRWRKFIGLPWGILLEGHGWWHIFTALAAYYNLIWLSWLRYCLRDEQDKVVLQWPSLLTSVPVVVRKARLSNGSAGKRATKAD